MVVNRIDWASMFFVGIGALLFPSARSSELQCRECGRTFRTKAYEMTRGDRIIRGIFLTLMLVIVVPILLFLWVSFFSGS